MSTKAAILSCAPTSYWPLDDDPLANTVHDEMGVHSGTLPTSGIELSVVPFGPALMPFFDGELRSLITIPDDDRYSHTHADALSVACWIAPLALNFAHTSGSRLDEQYVHFIEKASTYNTDVEWSMRLYNADASKPSRLSFYLFNLTAGLGAGAYMQYGRSANDQTPVEIGRWLFLVGQGEEWICATDSSTGAIFHKQARKAARSPGDKYNNPRWNVQPQDGPGPIFIGGSNGATAFRGSIAHVALWNRLLSASEIEVIWSAGLAELRLTSMYRPY